MDIEQNNKRRTLATVYLEQWKESGQSMCRFCKEQNLSYYTFRNWRRKAEGKLIRTTKRKNGFIPIQLSGTAPSIHQERIEIVYPNGVTVKLSSESKPGILKTLVRAY